MVSQNQKHIKPIIFWEGFPACGLLLRHVVDLFGDDLVLVATKPSVPFHGLMERLGHEIIWLDHADDIWQMREQFQDRNFVLHTGWRYKGWRRFDAYLKKKNDAKIVVVVDNRFRGNIRQCFGSLYFRLYLKHFFDAAFVPGRSGQRLMRFFGMNSDRIYTGNYGAYEGIYRETVPIEQRKKEFLFVGQLHKRKAVDLLLAAFREYRKLGGTWSLRLLGDGPLRDKCHGEGIISEGFAQPEIVAERMNASRVFILPSRDDNWGTVVCEAAACGMLLLVTRTVGASLDLVRSGVNGRIVNFKRTEDIVSAFFYFEHLEDHLIMNGSAVSKGIARGYDSFAYFAGFNAMMRDLFAK